LECRSKIRAQVELALAGGVFGDVGQPHPVRCGRGEDPLDVVVVHGRPCLAVQAALLGVARPEPLLAAQPGAPVLTRGDAPAGQLVGDEPVPERRVVGVDVTSRVDQVCIVEIPLRDGVLAPLVEGLGGEAEYPAGHRDRDAVGGQVEDQRVHHFGFTSRAK
jgi:hypothetical protein